MNYKKLSSPEEYQPLTTAFETSALERYSPQVLEWVSEACATTAIQETMEAHLRRISDMTAAEDFFDLCPFPGAHWLFVRIFLLKTRGVFESECGVA